MRPREGVVELIEAMTDLLARDDEGDMDSPAWESASRLEQLRAQLRLLSRRTTEPVSPSTLQSRFEGIAVS